MSHESPPEATMCDERHICDECGQACTAVDVDEWEDWAYGQMRKIGYIASSCCGATYQAVEEFLAEERLAFGLALLPWEEALLAGCLEIPTSDEPEADSFEPCECCRTLTRGDLMGIPSCGSPS